MFYIYQITNRITGKSYIGKAEKGVDERWRTHLRSLRRGKNTRLYASMRKHGTENFFLTPVDATENIDELDALERTWVFLMDSNNPDYGYNMTGGGEGGNTFGGRKHKTESKNKIRDWHLGKSASEETRNKLSLLGKERTGCRSPRFRKDVSTEDIVHLYHEGLSTRKIAAYFGMEKTAILGRLKKENVQLRPNGRESKKALSNAPDPRS